MVLWVVSHQRFDCILPFQCKPTVGTTATPLLPTEIDGQIVMPNLEFQSQQYPSVYREIVIHKDDRGKYLDPFKVIR